MYPWLFVSFSLDGLLACNIVRSKYQRIFFATASISTRNHNSVWYFLQITCKLEMPFNEWTPDLLKLSNNKDCTLQIVHSLCGTELDNLYL